MPEIRLEGATKRFGPVTAVDGMNLNVGDGEFVVLLGPTGAGKTTTLRLVAGLEKLDAGRVVIGGRDMTAFSPAVRDIAFVFQQFSLYPHFTVYENLAFPLRSPARRVPEDEAKKRIEEIAGLLRIGHKLQSKATQLSGGEMQRVAIGRALVRRPSIYLMDEPLSSLDAKLRAQLRIELKRIQRDLGATMLYVTHDQIEAMTMATHIGILREGRLVQYGTPREVYEQPADVYVATRLGIPRINLLPAGTLPLPGAPARTATVGVRTEHIRLVERPTNGTPVGEVRRIEHLGDQKHLHVSLGEANLVVLVDPHSPLDAGDRVGLELARPICFDADGRRLSA